MLAPPNTARPVPRIRRWRGLRWAAWGLVGLLLLVGGALLAVDSGPGHRLVAARIAALRPATGLRIRIDRIDGSLWSRLELHGLELSDPAGPFLRAPDVVVAWRPLDWLHHRLTVHRLVVPHLALLRVPRLHSRPGAPLLPGFDIQLDAVRFGDVRLAAGVAGRPQRLMLRAAAIVRQGQATLLLAGQASAGDRLVAALDAQPARNRLRLVADFHGPAGGVVAGLVGVARPVALRINGDGDWRRWRGQADARLADRPFARLALAADDGHYRLAGRIAPAPFLSGKLARLTAPVVVVSGAARLADRQLTGEALLASPALRIVTRGRLDLATSAFRGLRAQADLRRPPALFPNMTGEAVRMALLLDGPFRRPDFRYRLTSPHLAFDQTGFTGVLAEGAGRWSAWPVAIPLRLHAAQVTGVGTVADGILADLHLAGMLRLTPKALVGDQLALASDKLRGTLALHLNLSSGDFDVGVGGGLQRLLIPGLGIVDVDSRAVVTPGPVGQGARVMGRATATVQRFDNGFLRGLAGGNPQLHTDLVRDPDGTLHFPHLVLDAPALHLAGSGLRRRDGSFRFSGSGRQATYGAVTLDLDGMIDHPQVRLLLPAPSPALGLANVAVALDPVADGFRLAAHGGSRLGSFALEGLVRTGPDQPTFVEVADLRVSGTHARGRLRADPGGLVGAIALAGGGIGGELRFAAPGGVQRIDPHLRFTDATLALPQPVAIHAGRLDGAIRLDPAATGVTLDGALQGVRRGTLRLSRLGGRLDLVGDTGHGRVALAGGGGRVFDLQASLDLARDRIGLGLTGSVEGRPLTVASVMLTRTAGRWHLPATRVGYAGGAVTLAGSAGDDGFAADVTADRLPLALLDVFRPGLGLAGLANGRLRLAAAADGVPTGRLDLALAGASRSGLVASSQPADLALAAALTRTGLAARLVMASGGRTIGRAQLRLAPFNSTGIAGFARTPWFAQARYAGPAELLWRLIGVETLDLSGPITLGADVTGTPAAPAIRGTLAASSGRLESSVSGTVVTDIHAAGRFAGSRLLLDRLAGRAGSGTVIGGGSIDLGHLATGVGLDLRLQAQDAAMLGRDDIAATVTGPLFFRSDGNGGMIGGQVELVRGRFRLGNAAAAQLPRIDVTELNRRNPDEEAEAVAPKPWLLALHAHARNQLMVTGLGVDSEWRATLDVAGAVNNPAITGRVDLIRGGYQFAGRRFELSRGLIRFGGQAPPDPTLDITADADVRGFSAAIHVTGTGLQPQISFQSVPALPEDELLSRLLFGTSITNLSAPEALQLASAVASLRNNGAGGGLNLDPINTVRRIVRLDRLRILPADPTTGQKTAVAAGKYIGRRTYVELITDGQGYSASSVEFRITRWLSLLSTISTVGRQSASLKVSKDY